jgi:prefoldin alpha subunit
MERKQSEMMELNVLDMYLRQLEQQAVLLEQQLLEQQTLLDNLDELKKAKKGQEILFPFSRDIFVEGKLESDKVLVNVGSKTIVRKNIDDAKKIVEKQKKEIENASEKMKEEMQKILLKIEELQKKVI